jgi:carboxyl-terminal processing protease
VQQKAIVLKRMVELKRYSPRPVNDSFSVSVFKAMMNSADSRRLLFTDKEYQQLAAFNTGLDDELSGKGWNFVDQFSRMYQDALKRADSIIGKLL